MKEQQQIDLIKFIADHTIYINITELGFAYAITDIPKFVDDLILKLKNDKHSR